MRPIGNHHVLIIPDYVRKSVGISKKVIDQEYGYQKKSGDDEWAKDLEYAHNKQECSKDCDYQVKVPAPDHHWRKVPVDHWRKGYDGKQADKIYEKIAQPFVSRVHTTGSSAL